MTTWERAQEWEQNWWSNCTNIFREEQKQLIYANRMGLVTFHDGKSPYNFDLNGASVLDIGGGPTSLLLKCRNFARAKVVESLELPVWVLLRYDVAGIEFKRARGEDIDESGFDECWIYNVLQHTDDPATIIANARQASKLIRLFEWIDTPANVGHPRTLREAQLNEWLGGEGKVGQFTGRAGCWGACYYGIFPT